MDSTQSDQKLSAIATRVAAHAARADAALLAALVAQTFEDVDPEDLATRSADEMAGAVLSLWQLGAKRAPGQTRVRVVSPTQEADGWASRHTLIQVVNDDMPFLVDSTSMEINRQGLTAHLTI